MWRNKGQAVVELAVLVVLIVMMLNASLQVTKFFEALQKTQAAAYYAAQCWSIERPRQIDGDDLWAATESVRNGIESRVKGFLADGDSVGGDCSVNFGAGNNDSRVEVTNTVKINFSWHEITKTIKGKSDGDFYPLFSN
jgi:primosomal replication protein N